MADKKRIRKRKEEFGEQEETEKPSKQEYAVAKWLRANVPTKKTKFINHPVEYFTGSKAVDALLTSKFATGDNPQFTSKKEICEFLNDMLVHKFFHRAKKVPVSEQELKGRSKKSKESGDKSSKSGDETSKENKEAEKSGAENKDSKEKDKRKRKIRLEMHMEQYFVDGNEAYVWIYDPIPLWYWLAGMALLLGAIGICMFPLWPPSVRKGVYYLSIAAACFLVFIIVLAILRVIVFAVVWVVTLSRHHVWLLPNLTEDVGFFESFWPLYHYEYKGPSSESDNKKNKDIKKKKKKEKCSDDERETEPLKKNDDTTPANKDDQDTNQNNDEKQSESESENSQQSNTGRDFEIVDAQEVDSN